MSNQLNSKYNFLSSEKEIYDFINENENTLKIINAMEPQLIKHFPNNELSIEICDKLGWTTETKLLLNVHVDEEMFFNGMLDHFNEIYHDIKPLIENIENTVVLFPKISNKNFDRLSNTSAINLMARTAYFNNYNNGIIQREMSFREIPKSQQVDEIIEYCRTHNNPNISDIVYDLQLELFTVDDILDELEEKGIHLDVKY
ncbi:MAG: hypothetical protein IJ258_01955 [Methanobrevibacter sp.]|uniref:hypothetical protein n=1 Tax=Methanobrevibacter sp. TaxID=66852 RepID=UPI0025FE2C6F|nr:hypothetical protein [Methanobrevibacter sp.]MBQ8016848.1 hypothetical protein [Methanobrevibacter sp.]